MIMIINYVRYGNHYVQQQNPNSCTGYNSSPTTNQSTTHIHGPINKNDEIQQKMNQTTGKTVKYNTTTTAHNK